MKDNEEVEVEDKKDETEKDSKVDKKSDKKKKKKSKKAKMRTGIGGKIDKLQKQYNKILVDLFKEHAADCIEDAIDGTTGPIGSNIEDVIQLALDGLKDKVVEELGICGCDGTGPGAGIELSGDMGLDVIAVNSAPDLGDDMDMIVGDEDDED